MLIRTTFKQRLHFENKDQQKKQISKHETFISQQ